MRRIVFILSVFTWTFGVAQQQSEEYLLRRLTVEVENQIIASYVDWDNFITSSTQIGGASPVIQQSKNWEGYLGELKLSEEKFFETADFPQYASRARLHKTRKSCLTVGGLGLIGLGIVVGISAINVGSGPFGVPETNDTQFVVGLGIVTAGLVMEIVGLIQPRKITPASLAVEAADSHNARLKKSLEE